MSTHCGIAVKTESGYKTIYCHNDGYTGYMLPMLTDNYNSEELASKLVSMGDASSINKKFEPTTMSHSFDCPEADVCVFYVRDRKESWLANSPQSYSTKEDLFKQFWYTYIFENGEWKAYAGGKRVTDPITYKY